MCALRERALDWQDPGGVHDMRVASRRLRSAISDFKRYLPKGGLPLNELKTIANQLGAVRDEDVVLAALADLRSKADQNLRKGIDAIAREQRRRRKRARATLEGAIDPEAIAEFQRDFRSKLRKVTKGSRNDLERDYAGQTLTFGKVGIKVIGGRLKQITKGGPSVYHPLKAKKLHRLRIFAKKLRYALELFAPCSSEQLQELADEVGRWQTSLGELHDCDVWIDHLEARLRKGGEGRSDGRHRSPADAAVAVWLLHHFASERTKHYCYALARWHKWQTEGFLNRIKTLLNHDFIDAGALPRKKRPAGPS